MGRSGLIIFFTFAALASTAAPAEGSNYSTDNRADGQPATYLLAGNGDRHYTTRKHRKRGNYKYRHHRRHNYNNRHFHRRYQFNDHYYPRYNRHYYHDRGRRYYRGHNYRIHNTHHRDYYKWLAGAVVATELIHHVLDEPGYEYHDIHREYSEGARPYDNDHENHYRDYHNQRYSGH